MVFRSPDMMKVVKFTCFAGLLVLPSFSVLIAKDLATYHIGDIAVEDIAAPIAFDADNIKTATSFQTSETPNTPAIFRHYSTTNSVTREFLAEFTGARSNFLAAVHDTFHRLTLDKKTTASPDFGYLTTAFNVENKQFPVTSGLAAAWASGDAGLDLQSKLLGSLLLAAQQTIKPDELPKDFSDIEICCLVPVSSPDEKLTLHNMERSEQVPESSVSTISNVRRLFRDGFAADEQPLARAVSELIKPNCIPEEELTQLARDQTFSQASGAKHYAAGQLIVRRGAIINAQTKAVLDQLQKLQKKPGLDAMSQSIAVREIKPTASQQSAALPANNSILPSQEETPATSGRATKPNNWPVKFPSMVVWLLATISVISAIASFILARRRKANLSPLRAIKYSTQTSVMLQPELAPIVQAVKDTFVQELALQRRELILAQQYATSEIVELIRRLDKLQVPMQERLKAYELEIQRLEKELAERTEENRELLKLRIEMTRQQLEIERAGDRAKFN